MKIQKNPDATYSITVERHTAWGMRTFRVQVSGTWEWNTAPAAHQAMKSLVK